VGVSFSEYRKGLRLDISMKESAKQAGLAATVELSALLYERRVRTEQLAASLKRAVNKAEIERRKIEFDDAYVNWNTNWFGNVLKLRGGKSFENTERYIQLALMPLYVALDTHINKAYNAYHADKEVILYNSNVGKPLLKAILECNYVITEYIWAKERFFGTAEDQKSGELERRCPIKKDKAMKEVMEKDSEK